MDLLIDPVIFAVPALSDNEQDLVNFVEYLAQWSDEFIGNQNNFMVSEACVFALEDAGCYPYMDQFQALWQYTNETELECKDVFNACIKVLTNMPFLEDLLPELDGIALDETTVQVRPDLLKRQPEAIVSAFQLTLGQLACVRVMIPDSFATNLSLLTYPIEGETLAEIWAKALAEPTELSVHTQIDLVYEPKKTLKTVQLADIWERSLEAIKWQAKEMRLSKTIAPFKVSPNFNHSIKERGLQNHQALLETIFRKCVLLLTKQWAVIEAHELGRPQHQIGKWKAYRLYITTTAPGWRLHYWRRGNEFYLMQIVSHNEDHIDVPEELNNEDFCIQ